MSAEQEPVGTRRRCRLARLAADRTGNAAVEFAIIGVVLMTLLIGLLEIARVAYAAHLLQEGVDEAARFAAVNSSTSSQPATTTTITAKVTQLTSHVSAQAPTVTISYLSDGTFKPGNLVQVQASWQFTFLTKLLVMSSLTLSAQARLTIQN